MKTLISNSMFRLALALLAGIFYLPGLFGNTTNTSVGDPKASGIVTVHVIVEDADGNRQTVFWSASINNSDADTIKAQKIRAAAPPADPRITVGGTSNVVTYTSNPGWTVVRSFFKRDGSHQRDVHNALAGLNNAYGAFGINLTATGFTDDGLPGFIQIGLGTDIFTIPTSPGMPSDFLEDQLLNQLQSNGIPAFFLIPGDPLLTDLDPENPGRLMIIPDLEPYGIMIDIQDAGLELETGGIFDGIIFQPPPTPPGYFFGLLHSPLGSSQLGSSPEGHLVVSNIGSSGLDGVSIDLGESNGFEAKFDSDDPGFSALNTLNLHSTGTMNGIPSQGLGSLNVQFNGLTYDVFADYSEAGISQLRLEIVTDGIVTDAIDNFTGPFVATVHEPIDHCGKRIGQPFGAWPPLLCYYIGHSIPGQIDIPGFGSFTGNELRILAIDGSGVVNNIQEFEIRLSGTPQVTIVDEGLDMFHHLGHAVGQTHLDASSGTLTVSNIGSSGLDGVSVDLPPSSSSFNMEWVPLPSSPGLGFNVSTTGLCGGLPQPLGQLTVQENGGLFEVYADYSIGGTSSLLYQFYLNGEIVDYIPLNAADPATPVITIPELPGGCGKGVPRGGLFCYILPLPNPVPCQIPGYGTVFADEVRILAENAACSVDHLSHFDVVFTGTPSVDIINIESTNSADAAFFELLNCINGFGSGDCYEEDHEQLLGCLLVYGPTMDDTVELPYPLFDNGVDSTGLVIVTPGGPNVARANLYAPGPGGGYVGLPNGINGAEFYQKIYYPGCLPFEGWIYLGAGTFDGQFWVSPPISPFPEDSVMVLRVDLLGGPLGSYTGYTLAQMDSGCSNDTQPPIFSAPPFDHTFFENPYIGMYWIGDQNSLSVFDPLGLPIALDIAMLSIPDVVPDPRNNGGFWVADSSRVRCYNSKGVQIGGTIPTTGKGKITPDPRGNGSFWVADSTRVRCYNSKGQQIGSDIPTAGPGGITPDPRGNGGFWVADSTRVRCYNSNGAQIGGDIPTTGTGGITPDPRNNGSFWVADSTRVRCYNSNGQLTGTIITNTKGEIVPDPRNNGGFWVSDSSRVRCYDQNGKLTGSVTTTGVGTVVPDPRNNGSFWVADDGGVRCFNSKGRQVGNTITTNGKACITPDPRNNGGFWVSDADGVRCYNSKGQQIGSTIGTNSKGSIVPDPRNNGAFWVADSARVRCYNQNGAQVGGTIPTTGTGKITPDPRNNGGFWVADSISVRCYNQNGQQVGGTIPSNGIGDITPDPRKNGGFWVADEDGVRCFDQNGQQVISAITENRGRVFAYDLPYRVEIPVASDNCSGGCLTLRNNYNFTPDASDYYPVGTTQVSFIATDVDGNAATATIDITVLPSRPLELNTFMQGPYIPGAGLMAATLYDNSFLPPIEPFSGFGFTPINPGEQAPILIDPPLPVLPADEKPIDWIYIRVFNTPSVSGTEYTSKAGLLYGDGSIKNPDGSGFTLDFPPDFTIPDSIFVCVQPRNHLRLWSMEPLSLLGINSTLDLRNPTMVLPSDAAIEIEPGVVGAASGDTNQDGVVDSADRAGTWNQRNATGYNLADINMDGVVDSADRAGTWNNRNRSSE